MKKLIPATSMLLVSATMLTASTYAWFTMSREVEVQNIKLTATVPADMQISLGALDGVVAGSSNGVAGGYGTLAYSSGNTDADNGKVAAPDDTAEYWSNTVDVSKYYALGKIMPASSTNGKMIYFTPDAAGVGKTLKAGAKYYAATNATTGVANADNNTDVSFHNKTYETTLHAYKPTEKTGATLGDDRFDTTTTGSAVKYKFADAPDVTNDDGYYVDIPVWIRTSYKGNEDVKLAVDAYVTSNAKQDDDDLYLAARAVILSETRTVASVSTSGLLEIRPDSYTTASGDPNNETIVDFMDTTNASGEAVSSLTDTTKAVYGTESHYNGGLLDFTQLTKPTGTQIYGTAKQFWIRVWLEGEDPNCWNENAGQDFSINLKFTRDAMAYSTTASESTYPQANDFAASTKADDAVGSLKIGDQVAVTGSSASTFEFTASGWVNNGTFTVPELGQHYTAKIGTGDASGNIKTEADLISWLNEGSTGVNTKAKATTGVVLTAVDDDNPAKILATVITSGDPVATSVSYSVTTFPSSTATIKVNNITYADKTELENALKAFGDGNYIVELTYS